LVEAEEAAPAGVRTTFALARLKPHSVQNGRDDSSGFPQQLQILEPAAAITWREARRHSLRRTGWGWPKATVAAAGRGGSGAGSGLRSCGLRGCASSSCCTPSGNGETAQRVHEMLPSSFGSPQSLHGIIADLLDISGVRFPRLGRMDRSAAGAQAPHEGTSALPDRADHARISAGNRFITGG